MSLKETSKYMSLILRHKPDAIGITLDEHGWANVDELIAGIARGIQSLLTLSLRKKSRQKDCLNDLVELCSAMNGIYDMAYREYKPLVEDACHREMTEENLCYLMDRLMDFACEERCLGLFKQLCRHYYSRYPEVITDYIGLYRELWDDETEEDENEGSCDT